MNEATSGTTAIAGKWVLAASILASSMAFIDGSALNVALPALQADLSASGTELLWIVNGYLLTLAALVLVGGALGDRYGRKRVFGLGITLFMVASLACGIAPTTGFLIAGRMVQGIGGAIMIPGSLALINATFSDAGRGQAIGTWSGVTTIVTVAGPVLGGVLAEAGLWRGVFLLNLPLGLLALWLLRRVPESRDDLIEGQLDYVGVLLIAIGLAGLTYGFITLPERGLGAAPVWGSLLAGTVSTLLFVLYEGRTAHPMLPLELFRSSTFSGANLLTFFLYGALSVVTFFLSLNLIQVQGYGETQAGFAFTPFVILLALMSRWAGGLVDRIGARLPLIIGPTIVGFGFLALGLVGVTDGPSAYWRTFLPGILLFGVGMGITVAPLTTAVMGSVAAHYSGTASGVNNAVARTASVLTIAIIGAIGLVAYENALQRQGEALALPPAALAALSAEAANLGEADVPASVPEDLERAVAAAIAHAFSDTFRLISFIGVVFAWLSAAMAAWLVEGKYHP